MDKPKCVKCDSAFIYTRRDGSVVCRRCGFVELSKDEPEPKEEREHYNQNGKIK